MAEITVISRPNKKQFAALAGIEARAQIVKRNSRPNKLVTVSGVVTKNGLTVKNCSYGRANIRTLIY